MGKEGASTMRVDVKYPLKNLYKRTLRYQALGNLESDLRGLLRLIYDNIPLSTVKLPRLHRSARAHMFYSYFDAIGLVGQRNIDETSIRGPGTMQKGTKLPGVEQTPVE